MEPRIATTLVGTLRLGKPPFETLLDILNAQSTTWAEGYLVFHGGANPTAQTDQSAFLEFMHRCENRKPLWGDVAPMPLLAQSRLRTVADNEAHARLYEMLQDEQRSFAGRQQNEHEILSLVDCFIDQFPFSVFLSNATLQKNGGSSWSPVTGHASDRLLVAINHQWIAYWLTRDDE